jgi:hypothetical protein
MNAITVIQKKDVEKARIALGYLLFCPAKINCLLVGCRDKPCSFKITLEKDCFSEFPKIERNGECPNFSFRNYLATTPLMGQLKKILDEYRYDYGEKPQMDVLLLVIIVFLYSIYSAFGDKFPEINQEQIKNIQANAARNSKTFYTERSKVLFSLNERWYQYFSGIGEKLGMIEPYIKKAILIWSIPVIVANEPQVDEFNGFMEELRKSK